MLCAVPTLERNIRSFIYALWIGYILAYVQFLCETKVTVASSCDVNWGAGDDVPFDRWAWIESLFPNVGGKGCSVFRIWVPKIAFMCVKTFLKILGTPYVLNSRVIMRNGCLIDNGLLQTVVAEGGILNLFCNYKLFAA